MDAKAYWKERSERCRKDLTAGIMPFVNGRGTFIGLVANYIVCFSLNLIPFAHKPHLLLYGFFGIIACLIVASVTSIGCRGKEVVSCS